MRRHVDEHTLTFGRRSYVVFFAFGSRGDVEPLVNLACGLSSSQDVVITIVTQQAHQVWLHPLLQGKAVATTFVSLQPAREWDGQQTQELLLPGANFTETCKYGGETPAKRQRRTATVRLGLAGDTSHHWGQCLVAACEGLGLPVNEISTAAKSTRSDLPARLIVHSLFALEAFHIAEALGVLSLVASPCVVPYGPPPAFERRFKAAFPSVFDALSGAAPGLLSWQEVQHWMWPLFTDRWRPLRAALRLPPLPYSHLMGLTPNPRPLSPGKPSHGDVEGGSEGEGGIGAATGADGRGGSAGELDGAGRAAGDETCRTHVGQVLYGISPVVLDRPGYWPDRATLTGYWWALHSAGQDEPSSDAGAWQDELEQIIRGTNAWEPPSVKPICIDFGSMGRMGQLGNPAHLAAVLCLMLQRLRRPGIVLTGGWQPLADAIRTVERNASEGTSVAVLEQSVPHDRVLPCCAALICHGGAGTVGAAFRAGIPQVVCPLHFDQFFWGEKVEYMGVGKSVAASKVFQKDGAGRSVGAAALTLTEAIESCLGPGTRTRCQTLRAELSKEDGVAHAVEAIWEVLGIVPSAHAAYQEGQREGEKSSNLRTPADLLFMEEVNACIMSFPNGMTLWTCAPAEAAHIWSEIYKERCYAQHGLHVPSGGVVVDVGANIGIFTLWALEGAGGGKPRMVVAVEPVPPNQAMLRENLHLAGVLDKFSQVHVLNIGAGSKRRELQFTWYPRMPGNSTANPFEKQKLQGRHMDPTCFEDTSCYLSKIEPLESIFESEGLDVVDLLKVDVEGCELEVLKGISPQRWRGIRQVVVECTLVENRDSDVIQLLAQQGFSTAMEKGMVASASMVYAWRPLTGPSSA